MNDPDFKLLLVVALVAGLGAAAWYFRDALLPPDEPAAVVAATPPEEAPPALAGPAYPLPPPETEAADAVLVPLPPLDDSDSYFLLALTDIMGGDFRQLLATEAVIDRFVATVDNLPRSHVAERVRPVGRLTSTFAAEPSGDDYVLGPANFARYDAIINLVVTADNGRIIAMYRRFYPLFQEAYARLGYPDAYFNDRVVEVIDHLLATPEPAGPVRLVRPNVLYEFADPALQALSSGQKLLLRMGPEHRARVQQKLRELRDRVTIAG